MAAIDLVVGMVMRFLTGSSIPVRVYEDRTSRGAQYFGRGTAETDAADGAQAALTDRD